jgi:hypothetical protein
MAEDAVLRSTLSEKDIRMDGLAFIPYKVCVEVKLIALTVCVTTVKFGEGGGGGVGEGEGVDDFLHCTKETTKTNINKNTGLNMLPLFPWSLMIYFLLIQSNCFQVFVFYTNAKLIRVKKIKGA